MTYIIVHEERDIRLSSLESLAHELLSHGERLSIQELMNHPDFHYIDQPEHMTIKLEQVKLIQKEMLYKPFQAERQLAVIFNAHSLTVESQNALLKSLEDSPDHTVWILTTPSEQSLLPTILSRGKKIFPVVEKSEDEVDTMIRAAQFHEQTLLERSTFLTELINEEKEKTGSIRSFLEEYQLFIRDKYIDKPEKLDELSKDIERIDLAIKQLSANVNKQMLLDSMVSDLFMDEI